MVLAAFLTILVRLYQWTLRPIIGANCRFEPSCSNYAVEALRRYGGFRGTWLAGRRLLRCNPWVAGGFDPVPCNSTHTCHAQTGALRRWMRL
jgi:putative membrane protein insertion efficiency factor